DEILSPWLGHVVSWTIVGGDHARFEAIAGGRPARRGRQRGSPAAAPPRHPARRRGRAGRRGRDARARTGSGPRDEARAGLLLRRQLAVGWLGANVLRPTRAHGRLPLVRTGRRRRAHRPGRAPLARRG